MVVEIDGSEILISRTYKKEAAQAFDQLTSGAAGLKAVAEAVVVAGVDRPYRQRPQVPGLQNPLQLILRHRPS